MNAIRDLNNLLPSEFHFKQSDSPITKPILQERLGQFARKYPDKYAKNIHKIRALGEELAYLRGHNIGIDDLGVKNQKEINSFLDKADSKVKKMSGDSAKKELIETFNKLQNLVMKNDNNIITQAKSKGRGNPATATRILAAPVYAVDMNSEPYPFMIKNSLSDGLSSHEQFASGGQSRFASVQAAVSTSEPGAMGKVLIANTEDIKICCKDCGTKNGVLTSVDSGDAIGRYEAGTNKLIDENYLRSLKKRGKKQVKVRTPSTCQGKNGICSMCYGINSSGALHDVGHNIGIESSQAVSENAVQLILSAKHNVGGKVKSSEPVGFQAAKIVLNSTEKFPGKATVATTTGTVRSMKKLDTGGFSVDIGGVEHIVGHDVKLKVAPGSKIEKGDIISTGLASTKDILYNRGVLEARKHFTDTLDKIHNGAIDKRHFEVIGRGYLNLVKPKNAPNTELKLFDSYVPELQGNHTTEMSVNDRQITKKFFLKPTLHYSPGSPITNKALKDLRKSGIKKIEVSHSALQYEPVFKTYEQRPLASTNSIWQKINYRGIKKNINEEVLFGKGEDTSRINSDRAKFTLGEL